MVLTATDLPEPVVPAISKCGMRARSTIIGPPPISLPSTSVSAPVCCSYSFADTSSRSATSSRFAFGSSMPITFLPGTTATRTDTELMERAMSSARLITRDDFVPGAGSSSYNVTTGPGRTLTIRPRTPKSSSTDSSRRAFSDNASSSCLFWPLSAGASSSTSRGGSRYSPVPVPRSRRCWSASAARLPAAGFLRRAATICFKRAGFSSRSGSVPFPRGDPRLGSRRSLPDSSLVSSAPLSFAMSSAGPKYGSARGARVGKAGNRTRWNRTHAAPPIRCATRADQRLPVIPAFAVLPPRRLAPLRPTIHSSRLMPRVSANVAMASTLALRANGQGGAPIPAARRTMSFKSTLPVTPPRPILTGQVSGVPAAANAMAARSSVTGSAVIRIHVRPMARCAPMRQPHTARTIPGRIAAAPMLWISRSASQAPVRPSGLKASRATELFHDGSVES